jgi:carbonic anhydrase
MNSNKNGLFSNFKYDFSASIVVFFIAVPLCLGIASVSTGRSDLLFSGIIAGIVGGIVVGFFSKSQLGVTGPAAGMAIVVFNALQQLPFESFLVSIMIAGLLQFLSGYLKAGIIGYYLPSSVIKGLLAAIGIALIIKELPFIFGYDKELVGIAASTKSKMLNSIIDVFYSVKYMSLGAVIVSAISLLTFFVFDSKLAKNNKFLKYLPFALAVVLVGTLTNLIFRIYYPEFYLTGNQLVNLPKANSLSEFRSFFITPNFKDLNNSQIYISGIVIFIVATIETLVSVEATDKVDPLRRRTDTNQELKAQGIGNFFSGLLGGLPVTRVIIRSTANITSGGRTKLATILHGAIMLVSVLFFTHLLNQIPMASLAVILIMVGYKLTKVSLFLMMYKQGMSQFIPFFVTVIAILTTDLLKGVIIGMVIATFYILKNNLRIDFRKTERLIGEQKIVEINLSQEVTFLNKASIQLALERIEDGSKVIINGSNSEYITYDVLEIIHNYTKYNAPSRDIEVELINIAPIV